MLTFLSISCYHLRLFLSQNVESKGIVIFKALDNFIGNWHKFTLWGFLRPGQCQPVVGVSLVLEKNDKEFGSWRVPGMELRIGRTVRNGVLKATVMD